LLTTPALSDVHSTWCLCIKVYYDYLLSVCLCFVSLNIPPTQERYRAWCVVHCEKSSSTGNTPKTGSDLEQCTSCRTHVPGRQYCCTFPVVPSGWYFSNHKKVKKRWQYDNVTSVTCNRLHLGAFKNITYYVINGNVCYTFKNLQAYFCCWKW